MEPTAFNEVLHELRDEPNASCPLLVDKVDVWSRHLKQDIGDIIQLISQYEKASDLRVHR